MGRGRWLGGGWSLGAELLLPCTNPALGLYPHGCELLISRLFLRCPFPKGGQAHLPPPAAGVGLEGGVQTVLSSREPAGEEEASPLAISQSSYPCPASLTHRPCVKHTPTLPPSCPHPDSCWHPSIQSILKNHSDHFTNFIQPQHKSMGWERLLSLSAFYRRGSWG